jgi:hypothetical protein
MKRYILILLVLGLSLIGCSKDGFSPGPKAPIGPQGDLGPSSSDFAEDVIEIKKSGVLVTEEYPFTDFSQLEIGFFNVEVRQGETYSVVLEMDKNVLEHVQVILEGETLRIGLDPSEAYNMEAIHMRAEITMPRLTGLNMSLSDDGEITGFKSEDDLVIDLSKSSLHGEVHAGDLEITAEVGSTVNLVGSITDITVKAVVDSIVDLGEFECQNAKVTAEVSSQVTVLPSGQLDAVAKTNSKVRYIGDPTLGEIKSELGGSVEKQ